ncbi:glycosyl hydrolase family 18 protein [Paenibacillus humicus]|uniref:glycosyl hydrolase family 18 protein n=1 Tax=Paenibacillus humicus TaxID=412861 RepID=UPI003F15B6A6
MSTRLKKNVSSTLASLLTLALLISMFGAAAAPAAAAADPNIPQNLAVSDVKAKSITLTWDEVPGIDPNNGYQIYYKIGDSTQWNWAAWSGFSPKIVGGLEPETTYSFYVTSVPVLGTQSEKSNVVTATTVAEDPNAYPEPPLTTPQYLRVTDVTYNSIELGWTTSPLATGYDVYVDNKWFGGDWAAAGKFSYEIANPTAGQSVYFQVAAQDKDRRVSGKSNGLRIVWGQLDAPQSVQVLSGTRTAISLGWAPAAGATEYEIYRDGDLIGTSSVPRYAATGLTEGQAYDFMVVAKNSLWQSEASEPATAVPGREYNIVAYYAAWAQGARQFSPADIDGSQITHINYAFGDICWKGAGTTGAECQNPDIELQQGYVFNGGVIQGYPEFDPQGFEELKELKADNPGLKTLISVGGWSWSKNFSLVAADEISRRTFAGSAVQFLRAYGFDGFDIDWEYPVEGGETTNARGPQDKENFTLLVKTVREALDAAGQEDGKYYLLTIASGQGDNFTVNADYANSVQYLDFINIMTYDYNGTWQTEAAHNAPLYYDPNNKTASAKRFNAAGGLQGHLKGGVPNYKLVAGIPYYGTGWGGCASGGEYQQCSSTIIAGTWGADAKFDIADLENNYLTNPDFKRVFNNYAKVPYLYNEKTGVFISYDDAESTAYKTAYIRSIDIAGAMNWEISADRNHTMSDQLAADLPAGGGSAVSLPAPAAPTAGKADATEIPLQWQAVPGATGYDIFANGQWAGYAAGTEWTLKSLEADTSYTIEIAAIQKGGDGKAIRVSIFSSPLMAKTAPASDPTPTPTTNPTPTPTATSTPTPTPTPTAAPWYPTYPIATPTPSASPAPSVTPAPTASALPEPSAKPLPFNDVSSKHWASDAIARASGLNIIIGFGDGSFHPNGSVTRADFVTMLGRALGLDSTGGSLDFKDAASVPAYARGYIAQALEAGWLKGYEDGTFGPKKTITRAEIAVLVAKALRLPAADSKPGFADASSIPAWASKHAAALEIAGLMQGDEKNRFQGDQPLTRAQAAVLILNLIDYAKKAP